MELPTPTPFEVIDAIAALPFPPGTGPFRIKGVAYRGQLDFMNETVDGGLDAVLAEMPAQGFRDFYRQQFFPSVRYDVFPLALSTAIVAMLKGQPYEELVYARSEYQATKDRGGVYKLMLRMAPSAILARRVPNLISQYFDFGEAESIPMGKGHVRCEISGIPVPLECWYLPMLTAYSEVVLTLGGARNLRSSTGRVALLDEVAGVPTSRVRMDIIWDA